MKSEIVAGEHLMVPLDGLINVFTKDHYYLRQAFSYLFSLQQTTKGT